MSTFHQTLCTIFELTNFYHTTVNIGILSLKDDRKIYSNHFVHSKTNKTALINIGEVMNIGTLFNSHNYTVIKGGYTHIDVLIVFKYVFLFKLVDT